LRYNLRRMNKATILSTGRAMGRFYTEIDGKKEFFDFKK